MDVLYVVRAGEANEPLRYSLRSLANLPHDRVWIAGHKPAWVAPEVGHIPVMQTRAKHANAKANLAAACADKRISEEFYYFNDDFFILRPMESVPVLHRGDLAAVIVEHAQLGSGHYLRAMHNTAAILARLGFAYPRSYELHAPMPITKTGMREVLAMCRADTTGRLHERTLYGNYFGLGGAQVPDCKIYGTDTAIAPDAAFASTALESWTGTAGRIIRARLPEPCAYELQGALCRQ